MSDRAADIPGLPEPEQALARELAELGPLMGQQARAEMELDPIFADSLRARLVRGALSTPAAARPLRNASRLRSHPGRTGVIAAPLVAALIGLLLLLLHPGPATSFNAPYPTRADLTFSYPAPLVVIHRLTPTLSLIHPVPGVPYAGHLRLIASALATVPHTLPAYRLGSTAQPALFRRLLRIRAPLERLASHGVAWLIAADGGARSHRPLHSLAVSALTGELIYHDRRNLMLPRARRPLDRKDAIAAARLWLVRLGWPGYRMPLRSFGDVPTMPRVRKVILGWAGGGLAATEDATLWVTPNGSVIEAWVWPQIVQRGSVPARSIAAAWRDVARGALPMAVKGVPPRTGAGGTGRLQRTDVVLVLSAGAGRKLYLVPTYRFEGTARLHGHAGSYTWYSLSPGASTQR